MYIKCPSNVPHFHKTSSVSKHKYSIMCEKYGVYVIAEASGEIQHDDKSTVVLLSTAFIRHHMFTLSVYFSVCPCMSVFKCVCV